MIRRVLLLDLPPDHVNHAFVPAAQAMIALLTAILLLAVVQIGLKQWHNSLILRKFRQVLDTDKQMVATLTLVKEWVIMAKEHREKSADLLEKIDRKVEDIPLIPVDPSASGTSIPTVKTSQQHGTGS